MSAKKQTTDATAGQTVIRARRKEGGWFQVENRIIDEWGAVLGATGVAVWTVLARYANNDTDDVKIKQATIAGKLDISVNTVSDYLGDIVALGLAELETTVDHRGCTLNTYTLVTVPPCNVALEDTPRFQREQARRAKRKAQKDAEKAVSSAHTKQFSKAASNGLEKPLQTVGDDKDSGSLRLSEIHTPAPKRAGTSPEPSKTQTPAIEEQPTTDLSCTSAADDAAAWDAIPAAPESARRGMPSFPEDDHGMYAALIFVTTGWTVTEFERVKPKSVQKRYHVDAHRHREQGHRTREVVEQYQAGGWWDKSHGWKKRRPLLGEIWSTWADWRQSPPAQGTPVDPATAQAEYDKRLAEALARDAALDKSVLAALGYAPQRIGVTA